MKRISFNDNWLFRPLDSQEENPVRLPHDAMLREPREAGNPGGTNTGWYRGRDYLYTKTFDAAIAQGAEAVILEFEGVYRNSEVRINGELVSYHPNGYIGFYADITRYLRPGQNEVQVLAKNADQPNSRWYSGAGIYRPVWLWLGNEKRIILDSLRVTTLDWQRRKLRVDVQTTEPGPVELSVWDGESCLYTTLITSGGSARTETALQALQLWSPETPKLYTLKAKFFEDEACAAFGVRQVQLSPEQGLRLNGEPLLLRGACIHSDNGILGACTYPEAEERKVRLLRQAGYNAIRSAHNPCGKYLLDACDRLGMLVMDEYADMWYVHKTRYDYADFCQQWYRQDISDMIAKDYNHPSVILYSLGNEVGESSTPEGVAFFKDMKQVCDTLDGTRPVTCGINILFNYMYSLGLGIYTDDKAEKNPGRKVGSEFFNTVAGIFGAHTMKLGATLEGCDRKSRDIFAASDVAGYNYGILRYEKDLKKYPDRIILGTETFCADTPRFMAAARENHRLIGDFVWAGMDYLGEVGIGAWEYKDYAPDFRHGNGWISAGSGRLDLTGRPLGEALFTRVAFGLEKDPQIAVAPVGHTYHRHSPSAWKYSGALPSWSWDGCEEKMAQVEVYSNGDRVELFVNHRSYGKKRVRHCRVKFWVPYERGTVRAVAYDKDGKITGSSERTSAGEETVLTLKPEAETIQPGQLLYVRLEYTDREGTIKPLARGPIRVSVSGGELLALGHGGPYNPDGFLQTQTDTYYGSALAVIRACGQVRVRAQSPYGDGEAVIPLGCREGG